MQTKLIVAAVAVLLPVAKAAALDLGVGVKIGTLGPGIEASVPLLEVLNLRAGVNGYTANMSQSASGISYDAQFKLSSGDVILDWHPFAGTFRLSAGLVFNNNALNLTATPTTNQTIGNTTYTPAQIGTLSGNVTFNKTAPYFGLGWGNAVGKGSPFGINFELGVVQQGSPKVSLSASNPAVTQDDLNRQAQKSQDDLSQFNLYPVIALGMSYRF